MNAKIAAAISLGASSLVLIGSIGIANASTADATTTLTQENAVVSTTAQTSADAQTGEGFDRVSEVVTVDPQGDAKEGTTGVANQDNSSPNAEAQVDKDVQEIITKLLNLNNNPIITPEFKNKFETAKQNANTADDASRKASTEVDNAENGTKEKIQSAIDAVKEAEAKVKEAQKEIGSVETDFGGAKNKFDALKSEIEAIKAKINKSLESLNNEDKKTKVNGKLTNADEVVAETNKSINQYKSDIEEAKTKLNGALNKLTASLTKAENALNAKQNQNYVPAAPAPQQPEQNHAEGQAVDPQAPQAQERPQDPRVDAPQAAPQVEAPAAKESGSSSRTNSHYAAAGKAYENGILDAQALEKLGAQAAGESAPAVVPAANKASAGAQKAQANQAASTTASNAGNASASSSSSASAAAGAAKSAGSIKSAKSNNAKDSADSAKSADSSDSSSSESQTDSADSKSNKNEESNNEDSKSSDKSAQASGANNSAHAAGNNTTLIAAVAGSIIAGIGAIGAGWHFMRIRRK